MNTILSYLTTHGGLSICETISPCIISAATPPAILPTPFPTSVHHYHHHHHIQSSSSQLNKSIVNNKQSDYFGILMNKTPSSSSSSSLSSSSRPIPCLSSIGSSINTIQLRNNKTRNDPHTKCSQSHSSSSTVNNNSVTVSAISSSSSLSSSSTTTTIMPTTKGSHNNIIGSADSPPGGHNNSDYSSHSMPEKISKTNVYFRNLPRDFNDNKLSALVSDVNAIRSVRAVLDEDSCECKGYGFIDFIDEDNAREAIRDLKSRFPNLEIRFAREYEPDPNNVYISNLPKAWSKADLPKLRQIFEEFGEIVSCCLCTDKTSQLCNGTGFVRYARSNNAAAAIHEVNARQLLLHQECLLPLELKPADHHPPHLRNNRRKTSTNNQLNNDLMGSSNHSQAMLESLDNGTNMNVINTSLLPQNSTSDTSATTVSSTGLISPIIQPFDQWFNRGLVNYSPAFGGTPTHPYLAFPAAALLNPNLAQQVIWRHINVATAAQNPDGVGVSAQNNSEAFCNSNGYNIVAWPLNYLAQNLGTSSQLSPLAATAYSYGGTSMFPLQYSDGSSSVRIDNQQQ